MKRQLKKLIAYIMVSVMMLQINSIVGTAKNISTTLSEKRTESINEFSKVVDQVENYYSISTEGDMPLEELKTAVLDEY
ncbi:MAG: hypothetical protein PHI40_07755, partial [Caldisericia bacterium]|nr:hypothetical protein [Caldisericia bacterium]